MSSLNVNSRRAAVAAWRLPRASLGDTRGDTPGESVSAQLTSLSNGHHGRQHINNVFRELMISNSPSVTIAFHLANKTMN